MKPSSAAGCVAGLMGVWCLLGFSNWWWAFRETAHARPLIVVTLSLGALVGLGLAIATMLLWRLMERLFGNAAPRYTAFAAAVALVGPPALTALLHGVRALQDVPHRRPLAVLLVLGLPAVALFCAVRLGRWLQYQAARPGVTGMLRQTRLVMAWGCVPMLGLLGFYLVSGRSETILAGQANGPTTTAKAMPHIILVSFDTLRPDHLSALGYHRPTSPHIDAAIREGTLFAQTIASSSWTIPSHAALFTGRSPSRIGESMVTRVDSGRLTLPPEAVTLAEMLRGHGYRTAAFIGSAALNSVFGFSQGFEVYDDLPPPSMPAYAQDLFFAEEIRWLLNEDRNDFTGSLTPPLLWLSNLIHQQGHLPPTKGYTEHARSPKRMWNMAEEVNAKVNSYLDTDPQGPLFLFVHYFDTHSPFDAPPPFAGRWGNDGTGLGYIYANGLLERSFGQQGPPLTRTETEKLTGLYDEEVASMDAGFGHLLAMLESRGILDDAILVLFSDHGESLGEHGRLFHGNSLDEELIRLLFAVRAPGRVPAGRLVTRQVGEVDILPTILDLAGIDAPAGNPAEGSSLVTLMTGVEPPVALERPVFSELYGGGMQGLTTGRFGIDFHSVRVAGWKLVDVSDGTAHLYHVSDDPTETEDLIEAHPDVAARLENLLAAWRAAVPARDNAATDIDPERLRQLEALGYVGGGE